jgi:hypothetical protein
MAEPRFQPCCGKGSFPVSNLYRRSGLSRVGCSLLLSSPTPCLFIPSLLAELRDCYSILRPSNCSDTGVLWGRTVLRNCIADEAKNRAVRSRFASRWIARRDRRRAKGRNVCRNAGVDTPSQLRFSVVELTARSSSSGAVDRRDVVGASQRQARGAAVQAATQVPPVGIEGTCRDNHRPRRAYLPSPSEAEGRS